VTVTVDGTSKKATKLEIKTGADKATATVDVSIDLTKDEYTTLDDVVRYIDSLSDYKAYHVSYTNSLMTASSLDAVADKSIKTETHLLALLADVSYKLNRYSNLVDIEITGTALTNYAYTYMTGGAKGDVPPTWADFYELLRRKFTNMLILLTASSALQAEALAHVQRMEGLGQKQTLYVGGAADETRVQVKERAMMLNSSRAITCYPGIYHKSYKSGKEPLPCYMTAAMIAGRIAGLSPSEPITFDYFDVLGLTDDLLAGDEIVDDLITSGICTLEQPQNGGFRLVQGITTYLGPNNLLYREISVRRGADYSTEMVRDGLEKKFVGKKGTRKIKATPSAVTTAVVDLLEAQIKNDDIVGYTDIKVRFQLDAIFVDYLVAPCIPFNYVLVTAHFIPDDVLFAEQRQQQ
jgi:hypothetical protein